VNTHPSAGRPAFMAARSRPRSRLGLMLTAQLALLVLLVTAFGAVTEDVVGEELVRADSPVSTAD
jgi:hypothetical protein